MRRPQTRERMADEVIVTVHESDEGRSLFGLRFCQVTVNVIGWNLR